MISVYAYVILCRIPFLGCDDSFGMENRTIKDSQINASSVYSNNFAQNARLNTFRAWCAKFSNREQFIQVVIFLVTMEILLFNIQGFFLAK